MNSLSTTNEKRMTKAQRNLLKRKRSKPEHKAPNRYIEVAMNSLHRNKADYIPVNRGSQNAPPQRIPRVDEVESRGWGRRAPQSPSSSSFGAPQGNNKIYTYDVVFSTGEARINNQSKTQFPYKITKDISQPQFDKPTASQAPIRRLQVISILYRKFSQSRTARYWMPRHPRTCRAGI